VDDRLALVVGEARERISHQVKDMPA
jgi:hypothetical protein